jgi:hypothetical protein
VAGRKEGWGTCNYTDSTKKLRGFFGFFFFTKNHIFDPNLGMKGIGKRMNLGGLAGSFGRMGD